jgi:hypothetical protein
MNKIFPSNISNVNWKRSGIDSFEAWEAKTAIGVFKVSKRYLGSEYVLDLPADYPGKTEISCSSAEEAKLRASEEIATRLNELLDAE